MEQRPSISKNGMVIRPVKKFAKRNFENVNNYSLGNQEKKVRER
jgi:hypothetical protein